MKLPFTIRQKLAVGPGWGVLPSGRMLTANTVIGEISDKLTAQDYDTAQSVSSGAMCISAGAFFEMPGR